MDTEISEDFYHDLAVEIRKAYWSNCRSFLMARTGQDSGARERAVPEYDGTENARGGKDAKWGRKYKSVWLRLAKELTARKVNPILAIEMTFEATLGITPPKPQMILSVKLEERVARLPGILEKEVRAQIDAEATVAGVRLRRLGSTTALREEQMYRLVITDPLLDLTPLYRMLLAVQSKQFDLAAKYKPRALRQYLNSADIFDRVLAGQLPAEFCREARAIRGASGHH